MKSTLSPIFFILLSGTSHVVRGNPVGAVPVASPAVKATLQTIVTTATAQGSTYTLTYVPSTVTAATVLAEGTSSASVPVGAIVGALAGAGAIAALPLAIPKVVPEGNIQGGGPDGGSCQNNIAHICSQDCSADWFISSKKVVTTSTCADAACKETAGCNIVDITATSSHSITAPDFATLTSVTVPLAPPTSLPPLDYAVIQAYLGQQYQRLHIDNNGGNANPAAACEKDPAKGVLETKGLKDNIADFCKSNDGSTASPNKGVLKTYDQVANRMQATLQVTYTGDRGEGATYTVAEKSCNDIFGKILPCGPDKDHTSGGNLTSDKGVFSIEPWLYPGKLQCAQGGGTYGAAQDEALANIDDFCGGYDGQKINQGERKDNRYFQKVGGLLSTVSVTWEPATVGCGKGELFDHGYTIDKTACKRFLGQSIDDCNQNTPNFKASGTVTDQCARYQVSVETRETVVCVSDPRYTDADRKSWHPFDPADAHKAIDNFCQQHLTADPNAQDTSGGFSQNGKWPPGIARGGSNGVSIHITFPPLCAGDTPKNLAFDTGGDDCQRRLGKMVVDGCDTNPGARKMGGSLVDSGYYGCVQWQIGSIGG